MKNLSFGFGLMTIVLFAAPPSFANPSGTRLGQSSPVAPLQIAQQTGTSTSPSVVLNPDFNEFVRRNPYVGTFYDTAMFVRLTGLARRHMTYAEMGKAIDEVLSQP